MKLTTPQIEKIERYILSWDISNKTFYYELLDHFISAVEDRMNTGGEEFDYAFPEVSLLFAKHKYQKYKLSRKFFGPKALERQFLERASKGKLRRTLIIIPRVIFSKWLMILLLVGVVSYFGYINGYEGLVLLLLVLTNVGFTYWSELSNLSVNKFSRFLTGWTKRKSKLSLDELKSRKLDSEGEYSLIGYLMKFLAFVPLSYKVFIGEGDSLPAWADLYVISVLFLWIPFSILRFEENKRKLKA